MRRMTWMIALAALACGGRDPGGTTPAGEGEPAAAGSTDGDAAEGTGAAAGDDGEAPACEALAAAWCRLQEVEGAACDALRTRAEERGPEYCSARLADARAQIEIVEGLLAEEVPAGAEVLHRTVCAEAERVTTPTEPDPEAGEFTIDEALAGLPGEGNPRVRIFTRVGMLDCELFADRAPRTVANFVGLARGLRPYWDPCAKQWVRGPFYDGLLFHRVIPGFMIQGGDQLGSGEGDGGYEFADEFHPTLRHDRPGIMSMANSGPNTNGTQFFVTEGPTSWLNDRHSVFGQCRHAGVVARTARLPRDGDDRPLQPVAMRVEIYR